MSGGRCPGGLGRLLMGTLAAVAGSSPEKICFLSRFFVKLIDYFSFL